MRATNRLAPLLLMLSVPLGCASTTSPSTGGDAAVGQDVPVDAATTDIVDASPDRVPVDGFVEDLPRPDVRFEDAPPFDAPPFDAPAVCAPSLPPATPACAPTQCGNGRRDACERCTPCLGGGDGPGADAGGPPPPRDAGTCCETVTETCDGPDLGGASCASLGYAGGALACRAGCAFDARACDPCAPTEGRGLCRGASLPSLDARDLALATQGDRAGVAWIEGDAQVVLTVIDRNLNALARSACMDLSGARRVALGVIQTGWLLAVETGEGVRLIPLRPDATVAGQGAFVPGASTPILAEGPEGEALLVFQGVGADGRAGIHAARVNGQGAISRTRATLFTESTEPEYGSAVFTGDGWLVAMRVRDVEVVRLGLDLGVGASRHPAGADTEYPQLAWDGARAALTYSSFGGPAIRVGIVELTRDGDRAGPPRTLTSPISSTRYFNVAPIAPIGSDLAVLLGTHTGTTGQSGRIDLLRENAQPLMRATTPYPVTRSPEQVVRYRVAALAESAVVAWIGLGSPRRIGLARLTP